MKSWIKAYVIQIIPLIALLIYIIGFAYYIIYYYQFGINIISYITLSEILVSTLVPIIVFITSILACTILFFYFNRITNLVLMDIKRVWKMLYNRIYHKLGMRRKISLYPKIIIKIKQNISRKIIPPHILTTYALYAAIVGIIIPYNIYVDNIYLPYKYYFIFLLIVGSSGSFKPYFELHRKIKIKSVRDYFDLISSFILFFILLTCTILLAIHNSEKVKIGNGIKFDITTINNSHYTDSTYNYIGKCSNMYFLYDKININTVIINCDYIHDIKLYNKNVNIYENIILDSHKFIEDHKNGELILK